MGKIGRKQMFNIAEPLDAMKGSADADFFGLAYQLGPLSASATHVSEPQ